MALRDKTHAFRPAQKQAQTRFFMPFTYDVESFRECFEHEMTWLNGFMRNVLRHARKRALYNGADGRAWTYSELNADANRLANALLADDLPSGAVIMFMLFNSPEFLFCYLAAHKCGAVACPVNYRLAPGELAIVLEDSAPAVFIYDAYAAPTVREALARSSFRPGRLLCAQDPPMEGAGSLAACMAQGSPENPQPPERPHIYAETTRLYTSGTTNRAKAVPINSINEVFSAHDVIMHYPLTPEDRTMNLTPWFHRGGLHIGGPTATLYVGGEVVALREFKPRPALNLIQSQRVTYITGVPAIFTLLARAQLASPVDLSSLRGLCSMGSPFSEADVLAYRQLFTPNILNGYGTTETFVNTYLRPWSPLDKYSATGQACIDDDVRVVRSVPDGHAEPEDMVPRDNRSIGEIIVRAPNKSACSYVNNPEMTAKKFYRNFHYTGDLGTWDEDGYITVLSRKDDMIVCAGENIYPAQIEAALNEHPRVAECAVIGWPDRLHGQIVAACVVPLDESLTEDELRAWCAAHPMLPPYKRPRLYRFLKELPHTATGKLMHYRLRESLAQERQEPGR